MLALEHGQIPPSLHFERPEPADRLRAQPVLRHHPRRCPGRPARRRGAPGSAPSASAAPTPTSCSRRRRRPSPTRGPRGPGSSWLLSARTRDGARRGDRATSPSTSRGASGDSTSPTSPSRCRSGAAPSRTGARVVCRDREDAAAALRGADPRPRCREPAPGRRSRPVAFLFPGLGDQYPGMARGALRRASRSSATRRPLRRAPPPAPRARPARGRCSRRMSGPPVAGGAGPVRATDLRALLRRGGPAPGRGRARSPRPPLAQPALFAVEYALARLLDRVGRPAAGDDRLQPRRVRRRLPRRRAVARGRAAPGGAARAADRGAAGGRHARGAAARGRGAAAARSASRLSLAAVNGPHFSVVGGPPEAVADAGAPARRSAARAAGACTPRTPSTRG